MVDLFDLFPWVTISGIPSILVLYSNNHIIQEDNRYFLLCEVLHHMTNVPGYTGDDGCKSKGFSIWGS